MSEKFKPVPRKCKSCGKTFTAMRSWARYCDASCRMAYFRKTHPLLTPEELKQIKDRLGLND